jgi:CheY-like chemotaxis protein
VNAPPPGFCTGLRVLVVEDHDDSRDILEHILTYAGATVRSAASALEAVAALDDVDVVVTDYSMPGGTGLWLLDRARERPRPVPVIVLTGYAERQVSELAAAPFARVLRKPVDPWLLCQEVRAVVPRA